MIGSLLTAKDAASKLELGGAMGGGRGELGWVERVVKGAIIHCEGAVLDVATTEDGIMSLLTSNRVCSPGAFGYPSKLALAETAVPSLRRMEDGWTARRRRQTRGGVRHNTIFSGSHTPTPRPAGPGRLTSMKFPRRRLSAAGMAAARWSMTHDRLRMPSSSRNAPSAGSEHNHKKKHLMQRLRVPGLMLNSVSWS